MYNGSILMYFILSCENMSLQSSSEAAKWPNQSVSGLSLSISCTILRAVYTVPQSETGLGMMGRGATFVVKSGFCCIRS